MKISGLVRESLRLGFWLCGVLFMSGFVDAADHPAFQPVKELFAAMSKHDGKAMQETSTDDFQLLEHGEDWTMQQLVDAVQPKGKPYVRKNFFNQIRAYQKRDVAWVSYWNKAERLVMADFELSCGSKAPWWSKRTTAGKSNCCIRLAWNRTNTQRVLSGFNSKNKRSR